MEYVRKGKWSQHKNSFTLLTGNFLEFFEFNLYGAYAKFFSDTFLKGISESSGLFYSLAIFAAGFLARPLGALVFGHIGDRFGRKTALIFSVFGMSFATFIIGVLPIPESPGIIIPVALLSSRIIQGISCGGEYNGVTVYLHEQYINNRGIGNRQCIFFR